MNYDKMMEETATKYNATEQSAKTLAAQLNEAQIEMNRLQGEYRLLQRLRDEAGQKPPES